MWNDSARNLLKILFGKLDSGEMQILLQGTIADMHYLNMNSHINNRDINYIEINIYLYSYIFYFLFFDE